MPVPSVPVPSPMLDRFLRWAPLVGLAILTVLTGVMYGHLFAGEIAGDDLTFHLAETTRMADCLRVWDLDLWNPSANAGYASAYYYQAIPQLVPAALAAGTGTEVLPWFQLGVWLPLVLIPAAAYRALRVMGTPAWPALGGAFAVVMAASNSRWGHGADGTFSVGLYTQTWALCAFPLAMGHGVRWLRDGIGLGAATAWGLFVGLCHPFAGVALGIALAAGAVIVPLAARVVALVRKRAGDVLDTVLDWVRERPEAGAAAPRLRYLPLGIRIGALGALLFVGSASAWLTVLVDYDGFGGFPHRVADEVGPGFTKFLEWIVKGQVLDADGYAGRLPVLTLLLPVALAFGRGRALPWLWSGALVFFLLLGIGPHLPKSEDDLLPAVRFYGPFQICVALAIGAGVAQAGITLWERATRLANPLYVHLPLAAFATAAVIAITIPGTRIAEVRARVSDDYPRIHRDQLGVMIDGLAQLPPGRKQAREGATNHWANLLPYVYKRVPALIQMGGAGLQSSPNYDFIWSEPNALRMAWLYDAPYLMYGVDQVDQLPVGLDVLETEHFGVRQVPSPGLVSPVEVIGTLPAGRKPAHKAALAWLKTDDVTRDRVKAYAGSDGLMAPPHGKTLAVERHGASPGDAPDITARVAATAPTTFMLRESWHPRWRAFVDGREVRVRRVTPEMIAVDVQPGEHALAFRFDRPWWAWAAWLLIFVAVVAGRLAAPRIARAATEI